MRFLSLASFALSAVCPALLAAPPQSPSSTKAVAAPSGVSSPDCPVGFSAGRKSVTEMVEIRSQNPRASGQGVHLSLRHPEGSIASAEVIVNASSDRNRLLLLGKPDSGPDLHRSFHLTRDTASGDLREADLWMDRAGSISSVELVSLTYADGSVWKSAATQSCRAVPSPYLLIGSR
jgi:hypothetical protein